MPHLALQAVSGSSRLLHASWVDDDVLAELRQRLRAWHANGTPPGATALNDGEVYRVESPIGPLVFKRNYEQGWKCLWLGLGLRQPPLLRAYQLGLAARAAGLQTPEPLAFFQYHHESGQETVLITRFIEGVHPWRYLRDRPMEKSRVCRLLAEEVAAWHAAGFRHRDLKEPNILVAPEREEVQILDLVGAHRATPLPSPTVRIQDLGRLKASAMSGGLGEDDWLLLMDHYLRRSRELSIPVPRPQPFVQAVARRAGRKIRRNLVRSRPIA